MRRDRRPCRQGSLLPYIAALVFALVTPAISQAEMVDRIVAIINDEIITLSELNASAALARGSTELLEKKDGGEFDLKTRVLENLIEQKLVKQAADRAGIDVSEREIDNAVEEIKKQNNFTQEALLVALASSGLTYKEYRGQLKEQIREVKFVNMEFRSKVSVRDEEIGDYYKQNMEEFYGPPSYRLRMIFIRPEGDAGDLLLQTIRAGMEAGEDFSDLARQYSEGQNAQAGGDLGYLAPGEVDPDIERAIEGLNPGEISGEIRKPEGTYIIQLVDRRPGEPAPIEKAREGIHEKLFSRAMEEKFKGWLKEVRKFAHIEIRL